MGFGQVSCYNCDQLAPPTQPIERDRKTRSDASLAIDHDTSVKEAGELVKLAETVKLGLQQSDPNLMNVSTLKQLEEIEKLAKRIRGRMRRR